MRHFFEKRLVLHVFAITVLALLVACGGEEPTSPSPMDVMSSMPPPMSESVTADKADDAAKADQAPDAAARQAIRAMADGKIEIVWDMLPGSYQSDITGVVSEFGNAIDPMIWGKLVSIVQKSVELAQTRKSELMEVAAPMMPEADQANIASKYAKFLTAMEVLGQSKVLDIEFLKQPDIRALLVTDVAPFINSVPALGEAVGVLSIEAEEGLEAQREAMRHARVEIVEQDGDAATLEVTIGEETETRTLQAVEGKWVPQELADGWDEGIANAKAAISGMSQSMATNRMDAIEKLTMVEYGVDSLLAARDAEEMGKLLSPFFMMLGGQFGGAGMSDMPTFADLPGKAALSHTRGTSPGAE